MPNGRKYPQIRPDGSIFRSYRAAAPDPSWQLVEVDGQVVRQRRLDLDLGGQRALAEALSTAAVTIGQPEVFDLEHGGSFVNHVYLANLARVLACRPEDLIVAPPAAAGTGAETGAGAGGGTSAPSVSLASSG